MRLEVRLLGPLEVLVDGRPVRLTGRQRTLLPMLAVSAGRAVSVGRLAEAIWGADLPTNPRASVHTYLTRLRQVLGADVIETSPAGYRLRGAAVEVDAVRFVKLLDLAAAASDGLVERQRLGEALALWRGMPFGGIESQLLDTVEAPRLVELYLAAVERRIDLDLAAGRLDGLAAELVELTSLYPLRESLVARLLIVLDRGGRRAEALERYEAFRVQVADELGADPGPELRAIHAHLLSAQAPEPPPATGRSVVVPRQLPVDVAGFVGRDKALGMLDGLLDDVMSPVVITAIGGTAGIGKTALAVRWAHRVSDRFPDGQLYANLRGFDPSGVPRLPSEVLRGFLGALQVPAQQIPSDVDAQASLFRSLLAGKRMLVVLDNARDAEQVRPLLPGSPGCQVVVTSRDRLTSLVAGEGARPITLDVLSTVEARQLLDRRIGPQRVNSEPAASDDIIGRCGSLPLALTVVAARAALQPDFSLSKLADQLRDVHVDLSAFAETDPAADLRAVFSWSLQPLSSSAVRLLRLLGLHPGPDIGEDAAASLAGLPRTEVRLLLAELTRASLIAEANPGRYSLHDLLRAFAVEQAALNESEPTRDTATRRMLDHYLHTAHSADRLLEPTRDPLTLTPPEPGTTPEHPTDHQHALDWFTTEHTVLLAAVGHAAATGFDTHTWQLAWTLQTFLHRQGHWHDYAAVQNAAVNAAARLTDPAAQARAHRHLAYAYSQLGRFDDAHTHLRHALDLTTQAGDLVGQADTYHSLTVMWGQQGRHSQALDHARQALDLFRAAGSRRGQARGLNAVGWCHVRLGDHLHALTYCQQALTLLQELDDRVGQASTWDSLGHAHHHLGHHAQAITCYHQAINLFRDLGDRYNEANTLIHLGDTHHATNDPAAARDVWQQALTILDQLDHPDADTVRTKLHNLDPTDPENRKGHRTA